MPCSIAYHSVSCRHKLSLPLKQGCRILATTFLSLLMPLSFLLLSRLSATRYFSSSQPQLQNDSFLRYLFDKSQTTLILTFLVSALSVGALVCCVYNGGAEEILTISKRSHLICSCVLLFAIQFCLMLGIHGTIDMEINNYTVGSLVTYRKVVLILGLYESMIFWRRNVVKPVVDQIVGNSLWEKVNWVGNVTLLLAFGNLWCRRMWNEMEALVVLSGVRAELGLNVGAADDLGLFLYYLTVAIGVAQMIRGVVWVVTAMVASKRN